MAALPTLLRRDDTVDELQHRVTATSEEISATARRGAADAKDHIERAGADTIVPAWRQLAGAVRDLVQTVLRLVAVVPRLVSRVLGGVAGLLHRLGDQSASLANLPTQVEQKQSRRRTTLLVFGAGAVTGLGAGVAIGRATASSSAPDNVHQLRSDRAS